MNHSAGHGNSAFGLGRFNGPMKGSSNSAFAHGGQTFTRSGMGTWSGQRWGGSNWNGSNWSGQRWGGRNWSGSNWGGDWHHHNDVIFIGDFGFPWWWGWGYPYYGYGYPYGYGYDNGYGYPYGGYYGGTDYGNGYSYGGYDGSYYGDTGYGNGYPTHSRVAELQRRLARAGYYSGSIDGIMGPATRQAIRAFERDHGYGG
jgi:Putative peptidoglycan binding domain